MIHTKVLSQMGPVRIRHCSHHFATQASLSELSGKPKWLPLNSRYHDVMCTVPIASLSNLVTLQHTYGLSRSSVISKFHAFRRLCSSEKRPAWNPDSRARKLCLLSVHNSPRIFLTCRALLLIAWQPRIESSLLSESFLIKFCGAALCFFVWSSCQFFYLCQTIAKGKEFDIDNPTLYTFSCTCTVEKFFVYTSV